MILDEDTLIEESEEIAAMLDVIADELACEELWGEEYAKEIFVVKDMVERLTAALRILKRVRDAGSAT